MQQITKLYCKEDYAKECHHLHHKIVQNYTKACSVFTTGGVVVQKLHPLTAAVKVLSLAKVVNFVLKIKLDMKCIFWRLFD